MKKDNRLYLIVGFVVLLSLVVLVFGMFFLNDNDPRERFHRYYLKFTQVSTLNFDDPVKVNGVKLGKVLDIKLDGLRVMVEIRLREDVKISKDSEIRVQNIGLMGERQIGIILGNKQEFWQPGDTISGLFDAGIAEAMGLAGEVFDSTRILVDVVRGIVDSTIAGPDFRNRFHSLLQRTEELEMRIGTLIQETDPQLRMTLGQLNDAGRKVNEILDENRKPLQNLMGDAQTLSADAKTTLITLDSLMGRVDQIVGKMQSQDNTVGTLLNDRKLHDDLSVTVQSADSLFKTILRDGLDVNIDFF